ncbi:SWPV1-195 [Shearwaterpox virus]|uniref:SWPV1-195 n=1 Tax=Shearwaterpox virus TaxID=1974596 RepID=A0A1V0S871_CNPV|nr:SWPV1-195 [Shearwaterpox virus]
MPLESEIMNVISEHAGIIDLGNINVKKSLVSNAKMIYKNGLEIAKILIKHGANINLRDSNGKTPLYNSTMIPHMIEMTRVLINNGANVNFIYKDGKTVLYNALDVCQYETIKLLINNGSNVNAQDTYGKSPLYYAIESYNIDIVKLLIKNGANINIKDNHDNTPIYSAFGCPKIIKILLRNGADINVINVCSLTPIEECVYNYIRYTPEELAENFVHSAKIMISYLVLEYFISPKIINTIAFNKNIDTLYERPDLKNVMMFCLKELDRMKYTMLIDGYSLDILLTGKNIDFLSKLVKKVKMEHLKLSSFPVYKSVINKRIKTAKQRTVLVDNSIIKLNMVLTNSYWELLPIELKYIILSMLNNEDLLLIIKYK